MKLIKCGHCGRPYYDENEACPYCGHALGSSPTNNQDESTQKQPEQTIQEPVSSKKTDPAPEQKTIIAAAPIPEPEPTEGYKPVLEPEPQDEAETVAKPTPAPLQPKQNTQRANAIAAISASATQNAKLQNSDRNESDPNQIETILPPRKRHTWLWVLLVVLIMLAAAAYFFRDYVKQALSSLLS